MAQPLETSLTENIIYTHTHIYIYIYICVCVCSASYLYQRIPKGLNISPSIWQSYINAVFNCLQSKKYCEAIMDDLLLFTPSKSTHITKLEDLLKALMKLFRTNLQYMDNEIFIKDKRVCI